MSNTLLSEDLQIVCNTLAQRRRFLSILTPLPRYTPTSPYPQFTREQIDMRRKTEVLQYKKNSTQGSQLTKSQRWSQLNNANNKRSIICNKNYSVATSTTSCDVPGPPIFLLHDPTVPLYNYATNQNSYAEFSQTSTELWSTQLSTNSLLTNGPETLLFSLAIQNVIKPQYTFNFTVPIGIYLSGNNTIQKSGDIQITSATLNVYYYNKFSNSTPIYTTTTILNATIFVEENIGTFSCNKYLGNLTFPGITLATEYGFVYDFMLTVIFTNSTIFTNTQYYVCLNYPSAVSYSINNFTITIPQSITNLNNNYVPFTFTG